MSMCKNFLILFTPGVLQASSTILSFSSVINRWGTELQNETAEACSHKCQEIRTISKNMITRYSRAKRIILERQCPEPHDDSWDQNIIQAFLRHPASTAAQSFLCCTKLQIHAFWQNSGNNKLIKFKMPTEAVTALSAIPIMQLSRSWSGIPLFQTALSSNIHIFICILW